MTTKQFLCFITLFFLPMLYQRIKFRLNYLSFYNLGLRDKSGLQIHHAHWGLIFILISHTTVIFLTKNTFSICLAGLGWGLLFDEIVPHLRMPSDDRKMELDIYKGSETATIYLFVFMFAIFLFLFALFGK